MRLVAFDFGVDGHFVSAPVCLISLTSLVYTPAVSLSSVFKGNLKPRFRVYYAHAQPSHHHPCHVHRRRPFPVQVDGYLSHEHELTTRTGGEPLEDGREVTDHVVAAPQKVILTGQASDMRGGSRAKDAWQAIEELHKAAEPVRVITEWGSVTTKW